MCLRRRLGRRRCGHHELGGSGLDVGDPGSCLPGQVQDGVLVDAEVEGGEDGLHGLLDAGPLGRGGTKSAVAYHQQLLCLAALVAAPCADQLNRGAVRHPELEVLTEAGVDLEDAGEAVLLDLHR